MARLELGCIALVSLTFAAACGRDASSKEVVAPDVSASATLAAARGSDDDSDGDDDANGVRSIALEDDCDPRDAGWNVVGGCSRERGGVSFAEFNAELSSTLAPNSVIGHPSWRNDPAYGVVRQGQTIRVRNTGGRPHTFTRVAQFGGGKVPNPALNKGLATAEECLESVDIPPGGRGQVSGLAPGNNRYQCCFHPWMRAVIEVKPK